MSTISPKKLAANRRNARRSTGPRTPEGKAASSRNATRHGLFCSDAVLPGEDEQLFLNFRDAMLDDLAPATATQQLWADRIVLLSWKLRRITATEQAVFARYQERHPKEEMTVGEVMLRSLARGAEQFEHLSRLEQRLAGMLHRATRELEKLKKEQPAPAPEPEESVPTCPFKTDDTYYPTSDEAQSAIVQNEPTKETSIASPGAADPCDVTPSVSAAPAPSSRFGLSESHEPKAGPDRPSSGAT